MKIQPVDEVRNLGFFMDRFLKNSVHINKLSAAMFHSLRNIKRIQNKLDFDSTKALIQALVMSKLDYCNALLPGSSEFLLTKLQCIQNMACRIVCSLRKFDHVTQPMYDLHWLCIQERIDYKIAYIMFKCCNGTGPKYLIDLLPIGQSKWQLRSSSSNHLIKFLRHPKDITHPFPHMVQDFGTHYHQNYTMHKVLTHSGRGSRHICLWLHMA